MTAYTGQVAFPPLVQSTVYSAFPQTGQTYGLPPFGLFPPFLPSQSRLTLKPALAPLDFALLGFDMLWRC